MPFAFKIIIILCGVLRNERFNFYFPMHQKKEMKGLIFFLGKSQLCAQWKNKSQWSLLAPCWTHVISEEFNGSLTTQRAGQTRTFGLVVKDLSTLIKFSGSITTWGWNTLQFLTSCPTHRGAYNQWFRLVYGCWCT